MDVLSSKALGHWKGGTLSSEGWALAFSILRFQVILDFFSWYFNCRSGMKIVIKSNLTPPALARLVGAWTELAPRYICPDRPSPAPTAWPSPLPPSITPGPPLQIFS